MEDKKGKKPEAEKPKKLLAKKNFVIIQNDYMRVIKLGDDLGDIPEMYLENLKTEKVI